MDIKTAMRSVSTLFEVAGVMVILVGFSVSLVQAVKLTIQGRRQLVYGQARRLFGRSILLGLEVLVAADLIRTIAVEPTLQNLYVLGLLVVIRSFLSWSLDVELEGVWPWHKREIEHREHTAAAKQSES